MAERTGLERDFGKVQRRTKAMRGSFAVLPWDGYLATMLIMAKFELILVCQTRGVPQRPPYLELTPAPGAQGILEAIPAARSGPNAVPLRWERGGRRLVVDFGLLLSVYPFVVPRGNRAYIPVERSTDERKLLFRFDKAQFASAEGLKRIGKAQPISQGLEVPAEQEQVPSLALVLAEAAPAKDEE